MEDKSPEGKFSKTSWGNNKGEPHTKILHFGTWPLHLIHFIKAAEASYWLQIHLGSYLCTEQDMDVGHHNFNWRHIRKESELSETLDF